MQPTEPQQAVAGPGRCAADAVLTCAELQGGAQGYVYNFHTGEVAVQVQRRPSELAVWREGRPDNVATVPIEADYDTLWVRPYKMWTDMPVQFSGGYSIGYS